MIIQKANTHLWFVVLITILISCKPNDHSDAGN